MNEATNESMLLSATQIDVRAAEWLQRRHFWKWSGEDQAALDAWLAQSPAHEVAYWRLDAAWNRAERLVAIRPAAIGGGEAAIRTRIWPLLAGIAASAALIAAVGFGATLFSSRQNQESFSTAIGGRETVKLADGSLIELNTDTAMRTGMVGAARTVWLDKGEAYFQIRHDTAHPFVVVAPGGRIVDLGTQFSVRNDPGHLQVALVEGRARFESEKISSGPAHTTILSPGDVIVASAAAVSVTKKSVQDLARDLSWRRGLLVFNHATLGEAAAQFNRYNSAKLTIADTAAKLTFTSAFPTNGVEAFLRVAQKSLGLRVERQGEQILISR